MKRIRVSKLAERDEFDLGVRSFPAENYVIYYRQSGKHIVISRADGDRFLTGVAASPKARFPKFPLVRKTKPLCGEVTHLENLLSNSTALVVAAQMWYPDDIGSYVQWYMPLFLLVVFRPRLDRFTPPDMIDRQAATLSNGLPAGSQSTVAMSRMSFFR